MGGPPVTWDESPNPGVDHLGLPELLPSTEVNIGAA